MSLLFLIEENDRGVKHIVVSNEPLIHIMVKLMMFGLTKQFPVDAIYSSMVCGKRNCFEMVQERFGAQVKYVAIGSGAEEESASRALQWPYFRVQDAGSFAEFEKQHLK